MVSARPASVLVFDSGVGGLSVLQHIQQQIPFVDTHYLMDDAWCPYGDRHESELVTRIVAVIESGVEVCCPDLVVVACNTASTLALSMLRERLSIPVVGVVPALKPAAQSGVPGAVVLLATAATVNGDYVASLWQQFGGDQALVAMACPELVALAESNLRYEPLSAGRLQVWSDRLQAQFLKAGEISVASFVLGCTHFPLLRDELIQTWAKPALWLDSGEAVARRVKAVLFEKQLLEKKERAVNLEADGESTNARGSWWQTLNNNDRRIQQGMAAYRLSPAGHLSLEVAVNN